MESLTLGLAAIAMLLVFGGIGVPIGVSMIAVAVAGFTLFMDLSFSLTMVRTLPWSTLSQYSFVVIPMFILMGNYAAAGGIIREMFHTANAWTSGVRGGLYLAVTMASAGFAAVSGSTIVNAAVFTKVALPEMLSRNYNKRISGACIAAAGTFAALIPPSIAMAIYGLLTDESIGQLLIAGLIPGLLTVLVYSLLIIILVRIKPDLAPLATERIRLGEKMRSLKGSWAIMLLIFIIIGGMYGGYISPSSAGSVGALGALAISVARRRIAVAQVRTALADAAQLGTVIFLILIGGLMFSRLLLITGFVDDLTEFFLDIGVTPMRFIIGVVVLYAILGMFMEALSMMVVTVPFLFPIAKNMGVDPVWFGVLVVKLSELAVISPPVGINLFTVVGASDGVVKMKDIYKGIIPFVFAEFIVIALLIMYPSLSTWLPATMRG
ncbi:MAG: TRAP transporter large permease subunit [Castellaniella sp.]